MLASANEANEELEKRKSEEYQMQLFGLHSRTVYTAINQKLIENVDSRCQKLRISIEKQYNPDIKGQEVLENNITELKRAYYQNMKPHLKVVENVISKFICVPSNVLLEEDECQAIQYNDEEFHSIKKELEDLQNQARRVTIFNAALKKELENTEKIKELEDLANELCSVIKKGLSAKKLSNKTLRAIEKCKRLKKSLDLIKQQTKKDNFNPKLNESELGQIIFKE